MSAAAERFRHKLAIAAKQAAYREANKETIAAKKAAYYEARPALCVAPSPAEPLTFTAVRNAVAGMCHICMRQLPAHQYWCES